MHRTIRVQIFAANVSLMEMCCGYEQMKLIVGKILLLQCNGVMHF